MIDNKILKTENITERHPLTFYEKVYELPQDYWKDKSKVTVMFRAKEKKFAGAVYALKITSDQKNISDYSFY